MSSEYFISYFFADGSERSRGVGPDGIASVQKLPSGVGILKVSNADYQGGLADIPLAAVQSAVWEQIKLHRDNVIDGGAPTPSGIVDSDELSRSNIAGAALAALIAQGSSQPFSVDWTLKNNSPVTLDASEMIAVGLAVMTFTTAAHDNARALRALKDAAPDVTTALQIDYTAGWPS